MTAEKSMSYLLVGEHPSIRQECHKPARREQISLDAARLEMLVQLRKVPHEQAVQLKESAGPTQ